MCREESFHALRSLMFLGARCIVIVLWLFVSGLNGVVPRRFHVTSVDEDLASEEFSGLSIVVFEALQDKLGSLDDALRYVAKFASDVSGYRGDWFKARVGDGGASVDTDRSSAGGVALAPRKESRLSPERWEVSPLRGRQPVGAHFAGAEL